MSKRLKRRIIVQLIEAVLGTCLLLAGAWTLGWTMTGILALFGA